MPSRASAEVRELIVKWAGAYSVDADLLEAMVLTRSGAKSGAEVEVRPLPPPDYIGPDGSFETLSTVPGQSYLGALTISILAGSSRGFYFDLLSPVGKLELSTTELLIGSNVRMTVYAPGRERLSNNSGGGNTLVTLLSTKDQIVQAGTYRLVLEGLTESVVDLSVKLTGQSVSDLTGSALFGIARISEDRARSVGFVGSVGELADDDKNLEVAAKLLAKASSICKTGDTKCLLGETYGISQSSVSGLSSSVNYHLDRIRSETQPASNLPRTLAAAQSTDELSFAQAEPTTVCDITANVEPILPYPMPPNPYMATFTIQIGNFVLTPKIPQYVTFFEFAEITQFVGELRVRVFDPNWDIVEEKLLTEAGAFEFSQWADVRLQYGYATRNPENIWPNGPDRLWSEVKYLRLYDYSVQFLGHGVELELFARSVNYEAGLVDRQESYTDTPSKVVEKISENYGWAKPCCEETEEVVEYGVDKASFSQRPFHTRGLDHVSFINYELIPASRSTVKSDQAAYTHFFDCEKNKAHHHPYQFGAANIVRSYTYARHRVGAVIEWKPQVLATAALVWNAGRFTQQGLSTHNSEWEQVSVDSYNLKDRYKSPNSIYPKITPGVPGIDVIERISQTPEGNYNSKLQRATGEQENAAYFGMQAGLVVIGDPLIRPMCEIEVVALRRLELFNGLSVTRRHPTSGIYMIRTTRHIMQNGEYITYEELLRDGIPMPEFYTPPPDPPPATNSQSPGSSFPTPGSSNGGSPSTPTSTPPVFHTPGPGSSELTSTGNAATSGDITLQAGETSRHHIDKLTSTKSLLFSVVDLASTQGARGKYRLEVSPPRPFQSASNPARTVLTSLDGSGMPSLSTSLSYLKGETGVEDEVPAGTWEIVVTNQGEVPASFRLTSEGVPVVLDDGPIELPGTPKTLTDPVAGVNHAFGLENEIILPGQKLVYQFDPGLATQLTLVLRRRSAPLPSAVCPPGSTNLPNNFENGGGSTYTIPYGTSKVFCVHFEPPFVPAGVVPARLLFSWYDTSDRDTAQLAFEVRQTTGARETKRSGGSFSNGGINFVGRVGQSGFDPSRVAQGLYIITATNNGLNWDKFLISWGWVPQT